MKTKIRAYGHIVHANSRGLNMIENESFVNLLQ